MDADAILAEINRRMQATELGAHFHDGPLAGASIFNACRFASDLILAIIHSAKVQSLAEIPPVETRGQTAERLLRELFDAHYGMSYHHCGDGDGLTIAQAREIVAFVKAPEEKTK